MTPRHVDRAARREEIVPRVLAGEHEHAPKACTLCRPNVAPDVIADHRAQLAPHLDRDRVQPIGTEEPEIIQPAIDAASRRNILVKGPFPADAFFGNQAYKNYDAILPMYHDQGMIPFKTLSFGSGVNFTAGLPFIRTSPDHGTGYDIAGKNRASELSFRAAYELAVKMVMNKATTDERYS
jgi:hypothetical protein